MRSITLLNYSSCRGLSAASSIGDTLLDPANKSPEDEKCSIQSGSAVKAGVITSCIFPCLHSFSMYIFSFQALSADFKILLLGGTEVEVGEVAHVKEMNLGKTV